MNFVDIIIKKRDGGKLDAGEINYFVYNISALLGSARKFPEGVKKHTFRNKVDIIVDCPCKAFGPKRNKSVKARKMTPFARYTKTAEKLIVSYALEADIHIFCALLGIGRAALTLKEK